MQTSICKNCAKEFSVKEKEMQACEKIVPIINNETFQLPFPTHCHKCREQRRMAWRNEKSLYQRTCSSCEKKIIAQYPPNTVFPVYCSTCWWNDKNDGVKYGKDIDFSKSFFKQFSELLQVIPRINLSSSNNENCDYVNYSNYSKDCYLLIGSHKSEKCSYGWRVHGCLKCFDCMQVSESQYCYECVDCENCYEVSYAQNCENCSSSSYLLDCRGVKNSTMCCNLVNKEYCIFNQQFTKETYAIKKQELEKNKEKLREEFQKFTLLFPRKSQTIVGSEMCNGDYINNSKNCDDAFSVKECEDCFNVYLMERAKDCIECDIVGWPAEICYESTSTAVNAVRNYFSSFCWTCSDIYYSESCFNSQNLFGCTGLQRKQNCILNKQYEKEEYFKLVKKIINSENVEWGEFFPISISPFGYNNTMAQEYFPMTKNEAKNKKIPWTDYEQPTQNTITIEGKDVPKNIKDVGDDILQSAISCEITGKRFKITKSELEFYRTYNFPIPTKHPNQRQAERMTLRNHKTLWSRQCAKCSTPIETTYSPDRPEIVYCEKCYLEAVY